jgi:signal transduction histidine kinase
MDVNVLVERLAAHKTIGAAPRGELEWVARHGELRQFERGDVLTARAAGHVEGLFIVLTGHVALYVDRVNGREKIIEWHGGDVAGLLPYSRLTVPPGDSIAERPTEFVVLPRARLDDLIHECPTITSILVHVMVDRARHFTSSDLHAEKMVSLGKLSAGLAHELNNPASAIRRSAKSLRSALGASDERSQAMALVHLSPEQQAAVDRVRGLCRDTATHVVRSPLEQADREAAIGGWLAAHGADPADAEPLAETALTMPMLDELSRYVSGDALTATVRWLASGCETRQLAVEIEEAASRISALVDAVKGFTRMDQTVTPGPVDLRDTLAQTLAILKAKARGKGVSINIEADLALPPALGVAGELNQVWVNLIDNALDAVSPGGAVVVRASAEDADVVVRVIDDGPGIPADVLRRIFDPFFTTKPVGHGTGLGLDIVNRIVRKHRGSIAVESVPGRTEFCVTLPAAGAAEGSPV